MHPMDDNGEVPTRIKVGLLYVFWPKINLFADGQFFMYRPEFRIFQIRLLPTIIGPIDAPLLLCFHFIALMIQLSA